MNAKSIRPRAEETDAEDDGGVVNPGAEKLSVQAEAGGKRLPKDFERSFQAYKSDFETYVNHPSIVIYVLSNEMPFLKESGEKVHAFLTKMYDRLAAWDHTRQFIGNAGYGLGHEGDVNDVHRYWGWYYNSVYTFYNLRDPHLLGDYDKNQPMTFSECVGNFTGPTGAYNCIERKQLAAAQGWTGHASDQVAEAAVLPSVHQQECHRRIPPPARHQPAHQRADAVHDHVPQLARHQIIRPDETNRRPRSDGRFVSAGFAQFRKRAIAGLCGQYGHDPRSTSSMIRMTQAISPALRSLGACSETKSRPPSPARLIFQKLAYYSTWQTPIELALRPTPPTRD